MPVQVTCPGCGTRLDVPAKIARGTRLQCPRCRATLRAPAAKSPSSSAISIDDPLSQSSAARRKLDDIARAKDTTPTAPKRRSQTGIRSPRSSGSIPQASARRRRPLWRSRTLWGALLLIGGIGIGVTLWLSVRKPPGVASTAPGGPQILTVRRSGGANVFSTIAEALRQARPGARILVEAETWDEPLELGAGTPAVHIEGHNAVDRVRWRAPTGHLPLQPLVRIANAKAIRLTGIDFDGEGRLEQLIALEGDCSGVTLDHLQLRGFQRAGVVLRDCTARVDPVTLRHLQIIADKAAAALSFESRLGEGNRHILVRDCRLEGPCEAAILLDGPSSDLTFMQNRIYNVTDGILYRKAMPAPPLGLTFCSNTLCQLSRAGLHLESLPPVGRSQVQLKDNLFAHTRALCITDDILLQPARTSAQWIWASNPAGNGTAPQHCFFRRSFTFAGSSLTRAVLNITADAGFTAWLNGQEVGRGELRSPTRIGEKTFFVQTRRVYSFNVAAPLRTGANVLTVECTGAPGGGGLLAELTWTPLGGIPVTLASDRSWKVSTRASPRWREAGFVDTAWPLAREVAAYGQGDPAWQGLIWDAVAPASLRDQREWLTPTPSGNVRDSSSGEGFPLLEARGVPFELPTDTQDDAHFLRYDWDSILVELGTPGLPPVEDQLAEELRRRGEAFAARREWKQAAGYYTRALRAKPTEDGHFWFEYAALLLLGGDQQGYHQACTYLVEHAGQGPVRAYHAARACTLAPQSLDELQRPAQAAAGELQENANLFWSLTEQGALAFRVGRVEMAIPLLERCVQITPRPGAAVMCWLWLALCYERLGKPHEAQVWLDKACAYLDQHRDGWTANLDSTEGLHLHNWLEANVLRREAESRLHQ